MERVITELKPNIAVIWLGSLSPKFVKKCHDNNLQILSLVLGLDDKTEENQRTIDLGVDAITTDRPEQIIMKYGKATP